MNAEHIITLHTDFNETEDAKETFCNDTEEVEEEKIDQEWWDRNWVWHYRSPYVTGELMDKLEPYIKKLETTPAWHAYDKYLRSVGPFTEELSLDMRWKIAREWYEREDPDAFWDKEYKQLENNLSPKDSSSKDWQQRYQDSINVINKD